MLGVIVVYTGLMAGLLGVGFVLRPVARLRVPTRKRGALILATGLLIAGLGAFLPARESCVATPTSRLDEAIPCWQFHEVHDIGISAPPERVFQAILQVRADEIVLFRTLTWIRRAGRPLPGTILDADKRPIIDVALAGGFTRLAFDPPKELVLATDVMGARAVMNFRVETTDGGSRVTTETRVHGPTRSIRQRFAAYWRVIYPGSALIRRMWLRAIERRSAAPAGGDGA